MTNDRQTILGQISGSESQISHQETVQLTELLPVERSRIKDHPDNTDQETTDGLRALRSFALGQHENFVEQREFDCYGKIETSNSLQDGRKRLKKRKTIDTKNNNARGCRVTTRSVTLENDTRPRNEEFEITDEREMRRKLEERLDSVEDEVYYYRQQQSDICQSLNIDDDDDEVGNDNDDDDDDGDDDDDTTNLEILSNGVYRDMADNFTVDSSETKKSHNVNRDDKNDEESEKRKKKKVEKTKNRRKESRKKSSKETTNREKSNRTNNDEAQKDLRLKINGIIQANCQERDNNNVVEMNDNEISENSKYSRIIKSKGKNGPERDKNSKQTVGGAQHKTEKKYCCVMCDLNFKGSGGLRNHYKVVHADGPIFKCDECGKEFPLKERLKLHVRTHTGFKPYKCPDCPKSFARGGQLAQHRGTHSKIKPYRCNLCTGTFTCAANLALHVKRHTGQKDHMCQLCGRGFIRKDALKKHIECLHGDVKSFLCVICNKTFKGHLPQHMRTHAHDRPHGCATCGQRFAQKSQLTVHQRTHSGQRPFRCLVCWQAFAHSTALKLHTRRHTGERPFKCLECNSGFTQLPHWKKHMKCIHGRNEPYGCKSCSSFFRIKSDLENHEKACHSDDRNARRTTKNNKLDDQRILENATKIPGNVGLSADHTKFRSMNVERMRLLLAVLLKRISRPERLDELGFGKRLIDEVLQDSLVSAGKEPSRTGELDELDSLRKNLETFLEWTVPKEHWDKFRKINKTPEEILETLTAA